MLVENPDLSGMNKGLERKGKVWKINEGMKIMEGEYVNRFYYHPINSIMTVNRIVIEC